MPVDCLISANVCIQFQVILQQCNNDLINMIIMIWYDMIYTMVHTCCISSRVYTIPSDGYISYVPMLSRALSACCMPVAA